MKLIYVPLLVVVVSALAAPGAWAGEQTIKCRLELIRLDLHKPVDNGISIQFDFKKDQEEDVLEQYFTSSPQEFYRHTSEGTVTETAGNNFSKIVNKEPKKYIAKKPFRAAARLGSKQYPFVLDKKDEKSKGYDRLYFDLNGNGDLTDDKPIDALHFENQPEEPADYFILDFPRVDLTIDVDGKKLDYSFILSVSIDLSEKSETISVSLSPAVYLRGEIELEGEKQKIAVFDYNSNGRFDDLLTLSEKTAGEKDALEPAYGDMLIIAPEQTANAGISVHVPAAEERQYLARLTPFKDKYYEVKVSPTGDELTWTSSTAPCGQITSPHAPCQVEIISDLGLLQLNLEKSEPATIPAGQWRLLSYTICIENWKAPEKTAEATSPEKEKKDAQAGHSLLGALANSLVKSITIESPFLLAPSNLSRVSANGTCSGEPIIVHADQTTTLKFGPPYKLMIDVQAQPGGIASPGLALLSLSLQGADGELVSSLIVNGKRPDKPKLTITDPQGKIVETGRFEFG